MHSIDKERRYLPPRGDLLVWVLTVKCSMTVAELSRRIGVTRPVLNRYMNGSSHPRKPIRWLLCDVAEQEVELIKSFEKKTLIPPYIHKYHLAHVEMLLAAVADYKKDL